MIKNILFDRMMVLEKYGNPIIQYYNSQNEIYNSDEFLLSTIIFKIKIFVSDFLNVGVCEMMDMFRKYIGYAAYPLLLTPPTKINLYKHKLFLNHLTLAARGDRKYITGEWDNITDLISLHDVNLVLLKVIKLRVFVPLYT
jgi:hypothetical protein